MKDKVLDNWTKKINEKKSIFLVNSWEGGKSVLDSEIEGEKRNHKRYWSDEYEEELDQGKTKKVKKYHTDYSFNSGYNPFQKHQDHRNYDNPRVSTVIDKYM